MAPKVQKATPVVEELPALGSDAPKEEPAAGLLGVQGKVEEIESRLRQGKDSEQDASVSEKCPIFDMAAEDDEEQEVVTMAKAPKRSATFFFSASCVAAGVGILAGLYMKGALQNYSLYDSVEMLQTHVSSLLEQAMSGASKSLAHALATVASTKLRLKTSLQEVMSSAAMSTAFQIYADPRFKVAVASCGFLFTSYCLKPWKALVPSVVYNDCGADCNADVSVERPAHALKNDFSDMVGKSPVGAAVVMGLSVSQHMIAAGPTQENNRMFDPQSFFI